MANKMGLDPKKLIAQFQKVKAVRAPFESMWEDIAKYVLPRKQGIVNKRGPGQADYDDLYDTTAMTECELLSGALHGMLTNPAGYFFGMSTGDTKLDQADSVRLWIQDVVRIMHDAMNNSNFQTEVAEMYLDEVAFGGGTMAIEEDEDRMVRFKTHPIGEVYVEEDSKGRVSKIWRGYKSKLEDLVNDFGPENLPARLQKDYADGKNEEFEIIHALYPKRLVGPQAKGRHSYVSQYVLVSEKADLEVSGFMELPWVAPRWSKKAGENYGRGPGEKALPEARVLNVMTETTLRAAQKVVDPPMQMPDDGFMFPITIKPGGFNYFRSGSDQSQRISPILNGAQVDFGFQAMDRKTSQIRACFYSDQLKLREGPQMTAAEVSERVEQALRFLGPMLGRQQSEFLQPLVERVFSILDRKNAFPPVPAQLANKPLKVFYTSIMAMSQRMSEMQGIQRTMQAIAPFASADPSMLNIFDGKKAGKYIAKLQNFPQEIIRTDDEITAIEQQQAQAQQQAQQAAQQQVQADGQAKVLGAAAKFQQGKAG